MYKYCPKCKAEYRQEFDTCADCDIPLVYELPKEHDEKDGLGVPKNISPPPKLAEIFCTFNPSDIAIIKSLLEASDIFYVVEGEFSTYARNFVAPARIKVAEEQLNEARELLKDFKRSGP